MYQVEIVGGETELSGGAGTYVVTLDSPLWQMVFYKPVN